MNILERLIAERRGHTLIEHAPGPPPPPPKLRDDEAVQLPYFGQQREGSALAQILAMTGLTMAQLQEEAIELAGPGGEPERVEATPEFQRIFHLPRRPLEAGNTLAEQMTSAFSTPWGQMKLRPIQALALHDISVYGGLLGPMRVGSGKTLTTYLAPECIPNGPAKRPLLLVPAKLKAKTKREFHHLAQHWMGPHPDHYRIETYELLGRPQAGDQLDKEGKVTKPGLLERYKPDLIVLDEVHKVKNKSAAVTRRLRRYLANAPNTVVVAVSGTIIKRSLKDFAHIAEWCLPRMCPVPTTYSDLEAWAGALDETVSGRGIGPLGARRVEPGALLQLCNETEAREASYGGEAQLSAVRQAFRRRLVETPGVVATQDGPLADCSLTLDVWDPPQLDPIVEEHFLKLRSTGETPTGMPCADGITLKRHALEMALGMEYIWDPKPPDEWMDVRRAWSKFCREVIKYNRRGIDSEKQVKNAVDQGLYPDGGLLRRWRQIEPTFIPNTVAVWFSTEAMDAAMAWLKENPGGVVWTGHVAFAEALSNATGLSYYGKKAVDASGRHVLDHPPGQSFIASIKSVGEGQNLQAWNKGLVMDPPRSGLTWEQMLGRFHRDGQTADEVVFSVYISCWEHITDFWQAVSDGKMEEDTTGQAQKIQYADKNLPELEEVAFRNGSRWSRDW